MYNKLLERQIKRNLKGVTEIPEEFKKLLEAVSQSYNHHESDRLMIERSLELSSQELNEAYNTLNQTKHLIQEKNKEITDSINYAQRIQRALLASEKMLNNYFKDYFVFFHPKDIVSGDFYWASPLVNNRFALVTADSTGHGVPGAIMSMLNISCLNEAINGMKLTEPNEILNHTRKKIIEYLSNDGSATGGKDGMDCSIVCFDFDNSNIHFSAANNPVWVIREKQMMEFASDKMPCGKHDRDSVSFTQHVVALQKGDMIYTLTDGLPDQFGGPKGKKFMKAHLKELLINISHLPMSEQNKSLDKALAEWRGDLEQIDDICIIGVRV